MFKRIAFSLVTIVLIIVAGLYAVLRLSLADLDQSLTVEISAPAKLQRDSRGHTIVEAASREDAAYAVGFAHAQDRLFQMDLLRRSAAGEISELFGKAALGLDKRARFHQFRQRSAAIVKALPPEQSNILTMYAKGVNDAVAQYPVLPFEYQFLRQDFKTWLPEDSLLASFSMYMDLQHSQVTRDLVLTRVAEHFGQEMVDFILLPSEFQAPLDGSVEPRPDNIQIPSVNRSLLANSDFHDIEEPIDIGSNNWVVSGAVTESGKAMLSDDMHLGLRVPPIWYRVSLTYPHNGQDIALHGVSLPGTPGIIVGSNMNIAWGFTNANLDNTDWVELDENTETYPVTETIKTPDGEEPFVFDMSDFGPVKVIGDKRYALAWVAHQDYAVNLAYLYLDSAKSVAQARTISKTMGIPVQNMVVADTQGNIAWMPAGAITARPTPSNVAISVSEYDVLWQQREPNPPLYMNPENHRIWTANARVISTEQLSRYGNGGYALGSRGMQIRDGLFAREKITQQDFYDIQLDNKAVFLTRWQTILHSALSTQGEEFSDDLALLDSWQACACADSVGYSLVRRFRSQVVNTLFSPIEEQLKKEGLSLSVVLRHVEPAVHILLKQEHLAWLPEGTTDMNRFLVSQYTEARQKLLDKHVEGNLSRLDELNWGKVNQLNVQHPFSRVMPQLAGFLDMPAVAGFGDSYLPAVQNGSHGASQRFIIQPGIEEQAILTIPGGQSGHPLSDYYRLGFEDYIANQHTPLLPGKVKHTIQFTPH